MEKKYAYHLSGYTFETNVEFPELISSKEKINGSITITKSIDHKVPKEALKTPVYRNEEQNLVCINHDNLGFIAIWNNRDIEMTPLIKNDEAYIRMIILGSLSMLLSNCLGNFSLHAASIVINNKAVLFCAKTGKGKSSLAAYFYAKGYTVLADDVTNIYVNKFGKATALPSVPRIKLSKDALQRIGKSPEGLDIIPANILKYSFPMKNMDQSSEYPISHIYFPEFNDNLNINEIIELKGSNRLKEITRHIYRAKMGALLPTFKLNANVLLNLISTVEMNYFNRSSKVQCMQESLKFIEKRILEINK